MWKEVAEYIAACFIYAQNKTSQNKTSGSPAIREPDCLVFPMSRPVFIRHEFLVLYFPTTEFACT